MIVVSKTSIIAAVIRPTSINHRCSAETTSYATLAEGCETPGARLAPAVVAELFEQFRSLRDEGMTLLIVDQMADYALAIADRGYVLGGGRIVAQ